MNGHAVDAIQTNIVGFRHEIAAIERHKRGVVDPGYGMKWLALPVPPLNAADLTYKPFGFRQ